MTAVLAPVSERVRPGSVRLLRRYGVSTELPAAPAGTGPARDVLAFIEARLDLTETIEVVCDVAANGDRTEVLLTVLAIADLQPGELTLANARACGCRTLAELQGAWSSAHPRMALVRLIWFGLGDLRDAPLLIARGWPDYTLDRSRAMFAEPEPVSPSEHARQASDARQRYLRHQADLARAAAQSSLPERLATQIRSRRQQERAQRLSPVLLDGCHRK